MGLEAAAENTGKIMGWKYADDIAHLERPQRVRRVFEVLGPTFVKLGQILATRPDLFGPEWITEFEKLQWQAPPLDFAELRPQVEEDLGAPLEEIFARGRNHTTRCRFLGAGSSGDLEGRDESGAQDSTPRDPAKN